MSDRTLPILGYLLLAGLNCVSSDLVFLAEPAPSQSVLEGRAATLECRASPNLRVHWELKGEPLDISSRRYMVGTDLFIVKVLHDQDRGPFTCVITDTDTGASVSSRPAFLDITWLDEVVKVKTIGKVPAASGGDLHLSCIVEGSEPVQIQWFKNADGMKTSGKVNTTGYDLYVTGVNPLDNGVYRCVASNTASTVYSYNRVSVAIPGEQWAQIVVVPDDVVAKRGSNSKFDCIYQFADVIEWYYKQTGPLENSTKYNVLPNGSLVVVDASINDEGMYSCVGIRGESTEIPQVYSASLRLAYLDDPDNRTLAPLIEGNLRLINEGGDLEVGCNAPAGLPKPAVSWSRGSKGQVLSLRGVTKKDAGNYTCIISNLADTKYVSFQLAITVEPEISQHPTDLLIDEGSDALFRCEFAGTHKYSSVQWFKDGVPVRGPRYVEKRGFLNITGVLPSDQGAYLCQVLTKPFEPVFSTPAQLTVKGRRTTYSVSMEEMRAKWVLMSKYPRDVRNRLYRQTLVVPPTGDYQKLKFVPRPMNTNLELDTVRKVHCRAQGAAPPVIKWIKEDSESDGFPEHVSDINGTLHFNKVQSSDKGTYTCIASNYQGVINATIDIDVVVSPKFTVLPSNPTEVFEGELLMLDCVAEGDPKPAIHWDKNSNMEGFDKSRFKQLENGSLLIEDVQASDEGKYGCTAGNSGGLKRYEVSLIVRGTESYRVSDGNDVNSTLGGSVLSKTVAVTLGAAGAYMVLVIGLMAYCRCRSKKNKAPPNDAQDPVLQAEAGHSGERKMCNGDAGGHSDGDLTAHSHQSQLSSRSYGKLPITREHLTDMMVLGRGQFGDVCLARVEGAEEGAESVVMVKALQEIRDEAVLHDFKRELDLFGRLDHPNVVKLLGLCRQQQPHYMILQYTDWGDLKQMLMATKCDRKDKPKPPELLPKTMMHLARGLCLGMEHISNHRLVHRDLAARNCLVSSDLSVKVSLSALSKDIYRKEYFLHRNKLLPIRWMPPEGVAEDDYSTKSDVFSFGVTVWEIFARGDVPHAGRSDQEVLSGLADTGGLSLVFPEETPSQVISLVQECRAPTPQERPAFSAIALKVADIISQIE